MNFFRKREPVLPVKTVNENSFQLFGFEIGHLPTVVQVALCSLGVFVFYLMYGLIQESIFQYPGFTFSWYMTFLQFGISSTAGYMERCRLGDTERKGSIFSYAVIGFLSLSTIGLSNASLNRLNYPTQVMFKSCKLIPVMFGGVFVLRKAYTAVEYFSAILMTAGLILFSLADIVARPSFDPIGVFLICCALLADALIGNYQEKIMKRDNQASTAEMIFYSKSLGFGMLLGVVLMNGELFSGFFFGLVNPKIYVLIFSFALVGVIGDFFVMALVKRFGALLAVTITSSRKAVTLVLSFTIFPKPFSWLYVLAGVFIFAGIGFSTAAKNERLAEWLNTKLGRGPPARQYGSLRPNQFV